MKRKSSYTPRKDRVKRGRSGGYTASTAVVKRPSSRVFVPRQRLGEVKGLDTVLTLTPVISTTNTNGSIFVLNLVAPGSASYNRIGRKIYNKSVRVRGSMYMQYALQATTSDLEANFCRMVLVWDKQPSSGSIPTFDTIFGITAQDGTESSSVLAPLRYDNMDRFKVLKDCVVEFHPQATPPLGGSINLVTKIAPFDEYVKLGGRETVYSGQSATQTIADISSGALYLVYRVYNNTATTCQVGIESNSFARLRYTD